MGCGGSTHHGVQHPLRAPIISKKAPEKVDTHVNSKYCNDAIMKSWFTNADVDGSGTIDFEEFKKSTIGRHLTEEQAKSIFNSADIDKNGQIDYNEFVAAMDEPKSPLALAAAKAGVLSKGNSSAEISTQPTFADEKVKPSLIV
jgi:hypothetical protein